MMSKQGDGARREPLSAVDAAWLRMDGDAHPMVISVLIGLDAPIDPPALDRLVARLVAFRRFRQRVVGGRWGSIGARWEDDPSFDPSLHVHRVALPSPGDDGALATLLADWMSTPLDRRRPLWQLHVVEGVRRPIGDGAALFVRIHHALGDGAALVAMLLALVGVDAAPAAVGRRSLPAHDDGRGGRSRATSDVSTRLTQVRRSVTSLGRLLAMPFEAPHRFNRAPSRAKRVAWSSAVALDRIKAIAAMHDAKVNDVLMGALSGALRRYLDHHGDRSPAHRLRAIVPMYLRDEGDGMLVGNHFGLGFVGLPLEHDSPAQRVRAMAERMSTLKASADAEVSYAVLGAAGLASAEVERLVIEVFSRKGSVMVTNVPGPPVPLSLESTGISSMTVWAPTSGHVGLGVSFLSYAGAVRMSVGADASIVDDPERLVRGFEDELGALAENCIQGAR
jgi:diacylglycerol O-acyltransferase